MYQYGKIVNQKLQLSTFKIDTTWLLISNFDITNIDGFYKQDGTPDDVMNQKQKSQDQREQLVKEANQIIDLSPAESMYLMLEYQYAKANPNDPNDPNDSSSQPSLTPTGEDIITWGDRIHQELNAKMIEIKALG